MAKNLVIVESPAKAKTISRYLGKDFEVKASMGHVRDLPKSQMGIDVEGSFKPSYKISPDKKNVITDLKKSLKKGMTLWIATDEDREGEAIGWHLLQALKVDSKKNPIKRIVFHEITKGAITGAVENPRELDQNLVDAQQARRVLDRLVGYELSPLLWKKVRYGLSAGRVQSVAVRLIVDREREIQAFNIEEYWTIEGLFNNKDKEEFQANLSKVDGKKPEIKDEKEAKAITDDLDKAKYDVVKIEEKDKKRNPAAPFTTSTLQQEASRKLGFSVKKTMMLAQQLYEGIDMKGDHTALITYMRTDSVNLSKLALAQSQEVIAAHFGAEFGLTAPRVFKSKKGAQEAHEAIRPVDLSMDPKSVASHLSKDQLSLYRLIWQRTLASQMKEAQLKTMAVDIEAKGKKHYMFRASGQRIIFPGFMSVYVEGSDDPKAALEDKEKLLPTLKEGEEVFEKKVDGIQHFTKPPARYTEASLVKKLEEEGIGRPSTYAPTISTIINRGYIEKEQKQLRPTDTAFLVTDVLIEHFHHIVDYTFTAEMEESLDKIAHGKNKWVTVIKEFYDGFHKTIEKKEEEISKDDVLKERVIGTDPKTGMDVVARHGRFGPFVQMGSWTKEEIDLMEEKPRRASLPKDAYFETITLEEALKALELPRDLGKNKDGERVVVLVGRYGPYLKVGASNVSLPADMDPYTVRLEDVETVVKEAKALKKKQQTPIKEFGNDPHSERPILIKDGRFGPYVTDGKTNASIHKSIEPKDITFEEAVEMLKKKREKKGRKRK